MKIDQGLFRAFFSSVIDEQMMVNDDRADLDEITHALFLNRISVSIDPMSSTMISTLFL
jgi:hypothetical protein